MPNPTLLRCALLCAGLVAVPGGVSAQRTMPEIRLTEVLRFDADALDLSRIGAVGLGAGEFTGVGQPQDGVVLLLDRQGSLHVSIGRRGEGPGEFRRIGSLGWIDASLWVFDPSLRRLSYFSTSGRLLRTVPMPSELSSATPSAPNAQWTQPTLLAPAPNDRLIFQAFLKTGASGVLPDQVVLEVLPDGKVHREVLRLVRDKCTQRRGATEARSPFCNRTLTEAASDGSAIGSVHWGGVDGTLGRYTYEWVRTAGDRQRGTIDVRGIRTAPVTQQEVDSVARRLPAAAAAIVRDWGSPPERVMMARLVVGHDGTAVVTTNTWRGGARAHHLLVPGLGVVGAFYLPAEATVLDVRGQRIAYTVVDADGIERIVVSQWAAPR